MDRLDRGEGTTIDETAIVGYGYEADRSPTIIGCDGHVRAHSIIYADVAIGDDFATGHNVLVREGTTIGDEVVVGTNAVIDGRTTIGSNVSLQTGAYVPAATTIGDDVFIGPCATLTNDPHPVRRSVELVGPELEGGVSIGANATILPGVTIGSGSFVAAGAVVTEDVPPDTLAIGVPAAHRALPEPLDAPNTLP